MPPASIRGAKDAPKYKAYILPLIFTKRPCDVFDDELYRIAREVGSRQKAFKLVKADHKLVRFYLPLVPDDPEQPVWSVIRKLSECAPSRGRTRCCRGSSTGSTSTPPPTASAIWTTTASQPDRGHQHQAPGSMHQRQQQMEFQE